MAKLHPFDNPAAAKAMAHFAKRSGVVLTPWHRQNMRRHGVDYDGIIFSDPIPVQKDDE